ncbi:hypothetical protein [Dyella japonica]|uniref:Lipoprotein n=1 Tax=Dyella japonica TaxID=231455 RepID=A0ABV2JU13_9GAMM
MNYKKGLLVGVSTLLLASCSSQPVQTNKQAMSCAEHMQFAQKANDFASRNFTKAYANDVKGAEAQLFLIQEKGPGSFSVNYNAAEQDYADNFHAANAAGCDTSGYPLSPIDEFKQRLDQLKAAHP